MAGKKLSDKEISQDKTNSIMNTIALRAGYYRHNLDKFCQDYLGITNLKWFQKILLWMMNHYDNFLFLAARGMGKSYICALFGVCRCILWPGEIVLSVSSTYKQAVNLIKKVTEDFMQKSPMLRLEIDKWSTGQNDCYIQFKNGSIFRAITSTESSRGHRSHILLIDESRLVPMSVVSTILRPMNATPRQPGYLSKPEYAHLAEMPKEIYLTSAFYAMSELYEQAKSYCANMLDSNLSFALVDLPYQLSIKEGLLMRQQIINEKSEATFSDIAFMMEREGRFYGSTDDALFDYKTLDNRRVLTEPLFDLESYRLNSIHLPKKKDGEIRVLAVDIALLASKKHDNDATALEILSAIPNGGLSYTTNLVHVTTKEGLVTDELVITIMRYFYQYDCDYIVVDGNGPGGPIVDLLMSDQYDSIYGEQYSGLNVCNNDDLLDRFKGSNNRKVMYVIKANATFNNNTALALRAGLQNGNINLLINENNSEEVIRKQIKGYSKMSEYQKTQLKMPFIQTTLLINELINLQHETTSSGIKVKERSGMRKDRYSALQYGYYVVQDLVRELHPQSNTQSLVNKLIIRRGSHAGRRI